MTFFMIFAMLCIFPIFDIFRTDEFLGISIVNQNNQEREFTITRTAPDGGGIQTGRLMVPAGGQRARLINEVLGTPAPPSSGWLRVDSGTSECISYLTAGNPEMLDGTDRALATSTTILIPNVTIFTGFVELNHVDTWLSIVNPNTSAATVTAQLFALNGASQGSISISVPTGGSRSQPLSQAFQDVLPNNGTTGKIFDGHLRLTSNVPIAAWERVETPQSRNSLRGRTLEEIRSTTLAIVPHFATGGTYESILNLLNPTGAPVTLDLTAVDEQGNTIGETARRILAPGQVLRSFVTELFRIDFRSSPSPTVSGYIRIREAQGGSFQAIGDIEIFGISFGARDTSMLYPIGDTAANNWLVPFAVNSGTYFTGYSVVNPNELLTAQTDVEVEVLDSTGAVVNRSTVSLSPRTRRAVLISTGLQTGYLRFTSNLPIHVLGSIGTFDGHLLDQLPAIR